MADQIERIHIDIKRHGVDEYITVLGECVEDTIHGMSASGMVPQERVDEWLTDLALIIRVVEDEHPRRYATRAKMLYKGLLNAHTRRLYVCENPKIGSRGGVGDKINRNRLRNGR